MSDILELLDGLDKLAAKAEQPPFESYAEKNECDCEDCMDIRFDVALRNAYPALAAEIRRLRAIEAEHRRYRHTLTIYADGSVMDSGQLARDTLEVEA